MSSSIIKSPVSFLLRSISSFGNNNSKDKGTSKELPYDSAAKTLSCSSSANSSTEFLSGPPPLSATCLNMTLQLHDDHHCNSPNSIYSPSSFSDASTNCDTSVSGSRFDYPIPCSKSLSQPFSCHRQTTFEYPVQPLYGQTNSMSPSLLASSMSAPQGITCSRTLQSQLSCSNQSVNNRRLTPPFTSQQTICLTASRPSPHSRSLSPRPTRYPVSANSGVTVQYLRQQLSNCTNLSCDHFVLGKTVGTGSFGRVRVALFKADILDSILHSPDPPLTLPPALPTSTTGGRGGGGLDGDNRPLIPLVLKMLYKSKVIKLKQVEHVKDEKRILTKISHPFIVSLVASFQDDCRLCMLMEYVNGGELFSYLRRSGRISTEHARFFAAELVCAFNYLHGKHIVYRDLKPENLLIDNDGHIKITDFGFAKYVGPYERTFTLCGTHEYLAPETILGKGHGIPVDWWALGILIFEMLAGHPPFYDDSPVGIYRRILSGKIDFPAHMDSSVRSLLRRLLVTDPCKRLGCFRGGGYDVMLHRFFRDIHWEACVNKNISPPFTPSPNGPLDTSMFDDYPESVDGGRSHGPISPKEQDLCFKDF